MYCNPDHLDAMLESIRVSCNRLWVCSGDPQTYTQAVALMLASKDIDQFAFGASQNNGAGGRNMIMSEQGNVLATAQGYGQHMCLINTAAASLSYTFSRTFDKEVTIGSILTVPAATITVPVQTVAS